MHEINAEAIGKELLDRKWISPEILDRAFEEMGRGFPFDEALLKTGVVKERQFYQAVAKVLRLPFVDLSDYRVDPQVVNLLSSELAKEFCVFPLFKIKDSLAVVTADPTNMFVLDRIREESDMMEVDQMVGAQSEIKNLIDQYYGAGHSMGNLVETLQEKEIRTAEPLAAEISATGSLLEQPVVQFIDFLLEHAVKEKASDIHIEPDANALRVRIRMDGLLHDIPAPPKKFELAIICRIKVLADMNIAENRIPQDGRFSTLVGGKKIDLRVSTVPTVWGENLALRILDTTTLKLDLKDLGLSPQALDLFQKFIAKPYGMILVTGPTGSGKTTTLYTALHKINSPEDNIVTIEDPVEYRLEMIRQIQVNPKVGLTFATGLRAIVRQDPDVIMVGEIRDLETAQIAVQSALTGHLVFSTLHTNDAAGAAVRLIEMGMEPFLVSSSVIGVAGQRLVRVLCQKCKKGDVVPEMVLEKFSLKGASLMKGSGCQACHQTGFRGRIGIFEILELTEEICHLILMKASASQIQKKAIELGMQTMLEDGLDKVRKGVTTLDEVLRVAE
ncbi:MAG: Flp pilus assembly complex ATPase component TadA [Chlamydiae bacterium]|nr:Flp pilus assembly complex ATPase component TadA [Chlamydiota bacterium]MBI3266592.1 Flp pilus assembly complex ATPase component TadA [Chlamydiota bacterium]